MNKKILLIFLFAFLIRLIALSQSLWLDEAVTANVVKNFSFINIITKFSPTDFHPPLYYLFMKLWTNMFGYGEVSLRFPSIMFSLITGYFVFKIAKLLNGYIAGLLSAIFFLFNPLIVYYSQEARMYMMATFFLTAGLYYFLKIQNTKVLDPRFHGDDKDKLFFGLSISLAFLTFYGSIFFIVSFLIYSLYKKNYKFFMLNTCYLILTTLLVSPLLYQQLINSKIALRHVANWSMILGKANIKNLLLIPIKFSIGRISFLPKWLYWLIAGGWTTFIGSVLIRTDPTRRVLFLLIFPLILGFIVSFFIPMLQYFRFIYLIPIICILLGSGKLLSWSDRTKIVMNLILMFGFVIFSLTYLLFPQFYREDWKSLVKNLPKNKPIYMTGSSKDPINYYSNNLIIKDLNSLQVESKEKEVVVIPYASQIYGLDYKITLGKVGYSLKKEYSFREVTYEQWVKN